MLGGVISFTIGYHLLLVIIYYCLSFTIGLIPLLHVLFFRLNIANIGKKSIRCKFSQLNNVKISCHRAQYALHADRLYDCEKKGDKTKAGTLSDSRSYLVL